MKRLTFTEQALQDFQDIHDYIAADNPAAALDFIGRLEERSRTLCKTPGIGRKRDDLANGMRSSRVSDHLIFYRPEDDGITVLHVLHGSRDLPSFFQLD